MWLPAGARWYVGLLLQYRITLCYELLRFLLRTCVFEVRPNEVACCQREKSEQCIYVDMRAWRDNVNNAIGSPAGMEQVLRNNHTIIVCPRDAADARQRKTLVRCHATFNAAYPFLLQQTRHQIMRIANSPEILLPKRNSALPKDWRVIYMVFRFVLRVLVSVPSDSWHQNCMPELESLSVKSHTGRLAFDAGDSNKPSFARLILF